MCPIPWPPASASASPRPFHEIGVLVSGTQSLCYNTAPSLIPKEPSVLAAQTLSGRGTHFALAQEAKKQTNKKECCKHSRMTSSALTLGQVKTEPVSRSFCRKRC